MAEWHLIASEYPLQDGGVSDYTFHVAAGLAAEGDEVHVWCPAADGLTPRSTGVVVHRELNRLTPFDLRRVGRMLSEFRPPRRLLVQWVPHGFAYRAMNLPFCLWLCERAKLHHDTVDLMVHEPYLPFRGGSWMQGAVAVVHRLMTITILRAASRVWISIPAWEGRLLPYTLGKRLPFGWLPIPSNIPVAKDQAGVIAARNRYAQNGTLLMGHFGTGERNIKLLLGAATSLLLEAYPDVTLLLMGRGSEDLLKELTKKHPNLEGRIHATGWLEPEALSVHISACDLMLQPYPDGISSRRTSAMVGLSHGIPVLTTTGRLTESLWADSRAVALVPIENISAISESAEGLLTDSGERKRMGVRATNFYHERFDIRHTIRALRDGL